MIDALGLLALLIGLELVLGVDNVLVIAIFVARLPAERRQKARVMGLMVAMLARIVMLWVVVMLASLTTPLVMNLSVRDLVLLAGGLFLLYKAVRAKSITPWNFQTRRSMPANRRLPRRATGPW